jgi:hypothetical protein
MDFHRSWSSTNTHTHTVRQLLSKSPKENICSASCCAKNPEIGFLVPIDFLFYFYLDA